MSFSAQGGSKRLLKGTIIENHFLRLQCNPCMYQTKLQTWHVAGPETHMESAAGKKIVTRDAQAK